MRSAKRKVGTMPSQKNRQTLDHLLEEYGQTYAEEAGIHVENEPVSLFQLLVLSTLLSARIGAAQATSAMRGLIAAGYTTPEKMGAATWSQRVKAQKLGLPKTARGLSAHGGRGEFPRMVAAVLRAARAARLGRQGI